VATQKPTTAKRLKMAERAQQLMELHFPGTPEPWLWHRTKNDGYISIPRTLPLAMEAIDTRSKGQPAGHTYFCLWARSPDHPVIAIENPAIFAYEAGFKGERAVDTWRRRMKQLQQFGFIETKRGPSGDFHYVLLKNPNSVMESLHSCGLIQKDLYSRFIERAVDVGAFGEIEAFRVFLASQQAAENQPAQQQAAGGVSPSASLATTLLS
jgi:hypothetical protein